MARTAERFDELLTRWRAAEPAERPRLERVLREEFEETLATLVIDMSGFARHVIRDGIVPFLARMNAMRSIAVPIIERSGGSVVKFVGDDVLAVLPDPDVAVAAALEIHTASDTYSTAHPTLAFHLCIGIGYGPTLHVPGADVWGDEVNRAFKLGEEIGGATDIQLTKCAYDALRGDRSRFSPGLHTVSGVVVEAYAFRPNTSVDGITDQPGQAEQPEAEGGEKGAE